MTAFKPAVAFGTKTRSSGRAPRKAASAARDSASQLVEAAGEERDRVALELALQLLVAGEDRRRAGAVAAVVEEGDLRVEQEIHAATVSRCGASSRSLNPRLPRSVQLLQLGGLMNAFGNGLVVPFLLIYLHNERGIGLGVAGLILATNAGVSLISGPIGGVARRPRRRQDDADRRARLPHGRLRRLRVRREPVAGLPRERRDRDRQRPLLARAVDAARRADDARAALGHVRDAARGDEPRHRPRRRRRRLHRLRELPGALRARRAHVRRLRRGADGLRPRAGAPARNAPRAPAATAPSSGTRSSWR